MFTVRYTYDTIVTDRILIIQFSISPEVEAVEGPSVSPPTVGPSTVSPPTQRTAAQPQRKRTWVCGSFVNCALHHVIRLLL